MATNTENTETTPHFNATTKKRALALIFSVLLMDVIGITLLSPVAPQIVLRYSDSALAVSMITVVYAVGQFFAAPLLGKIGDKVGRRPVLLLSLLGQAIGYIVFAIGGSLWILFLGRLIGGITSGNLSTSSAYIADVSEPHERSKNFGLISTAWSLGLILGPGIGGLFAQVSLEAPAYIAGIVTLINMVLGFYFLPESLPTSRRQTAPLTSRDFNPFSSILDMAKKPGLGMILLVSALFGFAFNGVNSTSAIFVIDKFNAETWQLSVLMMLAGIAIALTNTVLVPRLVPKFGEKPTAVYSMFGLGVAHLLMFLAPLLVLAIIANMLGAMMYAFIFPAITTLSVERVSHQEAGMLMGVNSAVGSLMNILGPVTAGLIYDHIVVGAPYIMSLIVLIIAAFMLLSTHKPDQQPA